MTDYNLSNKFLFWYTALTNLKATEIKGKDIVLDDFAARRFGIGIVVDGADEGLPVLGILSKDIDAVLDIEWTSAGIILGHQKRDWVALSAKDIRDDNAVSIDEVPLRMWIPFPVGAFDGWNSNRPKEIQIRKIKNSAKTKKVIADKTPLKSLSLTYKNKWN